MALNLDLDAKELNNNSSKSNIPQRPATSASAQRSSNPSQWQNYTEINIAKAERERDNSKSLRSTVDSILRQTTGYYKNLNS